MAKSLEGRIAVVTGASRGIGYATAKVLAAEGAHIVAVARTVGGLEDLDDDIKKAGGTATLVPADLNDFDAIDRLGAAIMSVGASLICCSAMLASSASCHRSAISIQRPGTMCWRSMSRQTGG